MVGHSRMQPGMPLLATLILPVNNKVSIVNWTRWMRSRIVGYRCERKGALPSREVKHVIRRKTKFTEQPSRFAFEPLLKWPDRLTLAWGPLPVRDRGTICPFPLVAVFGDEHKASHWLSAPLALLGNLSPSQLLISDEGIQRVDEILTRIEHNIFS